MFFSNSGCWRWFLGLLTILLASLPAFSAEWQDLGGGRSSAQAFQYEVEESSESLSLHCTLGGLESEQLEGGGQTFLRLRVPGLGVAGAVGQPEVPVWRRLVEAPSNAASVKLVQISTSHDELAVAKAAQLPLWPVQAPREKIPNGKAVPFAWDKAYYKSASTAATEPVELSYFGRVRGRSYYLLSVYPLAITPSENKVATRTSLSFMIRWDCGKAAAQWSPARYGAPMIEGPYQALSVNADSAKSYTTYPAGYLIISAPEFVENEALASFVQWKRERGFSTSLISTAETGESATEIRAYIQDAYNSWTVPPVFLLLVGDTDTIPYWTGGGMGSPPTDLNYTTIDGEEYNTPDLWCGRFSVRDNATLTTLINKTLDYELGNWTTAAGWEAQASFMTGSDNYTITEGTHNAVISSYFEPAGLTCEKIYTVTYDGVSQDISNALNAGRSWLVYSGHGGETSWADGPPFYASSVNASTNDVYPIVLSFACVTGYYPRSECFMETWIRADHGAILAWGSSVNSYWGEDDILEREVMDSFFTAGQSWACGALDRGKLGFFAHYGDSSTTQRYFEMYNLMGDPSVEIRTQATQELNVSHLPGIPSGVDSFVVDVSVDDAVVTITQGAVVHGLALSAAGSANVPLSPPLSSGEALITVTAPNTRPYQQSVSVLAGSDGFAALDRAIYPCPSSLAIMISDADLIGAASCTVLLSTSSGDLESVILPVTETASLFQRTFPVVCGESWSHENDLLEVVHGDEITLLYEDEDDGTGAARQKTDSAIVDSQGPVIFNVVITEISSSSARVSFETDESSSAAIFCGEICSPPYSLSQSSGTPATVHSFTLEGLEADLRYYVAVDAWDLSGNQDEDTSCYDFKTLERKEIIFSFDEDPGWTTEGAWEFGLPQGQGGDPSSAYTGQMIYGYNLAGEYADNSPAYALTTTAMDFRSYENVSLSFWRWLGVENASFDQAAIEVSDDGSTWHSVWSHTAGDYVDSDWLECHYDLSDVADDQATVYVRWIMGSTDSSVVYCGWNIDDVVFSGDAMGSLSLSPNTPLNVTGEAGGPFSPASYSYTLENLEATSLAWSVSHTEAWISVTPESGTLATSGTASVEVSINANAASLEEGLYLDTLTFTNLNRNQSQEVAVSLAIGEAIHSADQDGDYEINLTELLRLIQFFNSTGYCCAAESEDGYAPGTGDESCSAHHSDYNPQDWMVDLSELLRLIQFYNLGGYHSDCSSEDGFAAGPGTHESCD